jgi:hypothetical protein
MSCKKIIFDGLKNNCYLLYFVNKCTIFDVINMILKMKCDVVLLQTFEIATNNILIHFFEYRVI